MSALFASQTKDHSVPTGRQETEPYAADGIAGGTARQPNPTQNPSAAKEGGTWARAEVGHAEEGLFDRSLARPLSLPTHNFNALKHHICRNITWHRACQKSLPLIARVDGRRRPNQRSQALYSRTVQPVHAPCGDDLSRTLGQRAWSPRHL
jgi:hypothetical protein